MLQCVLSEEVSFELLWESICYNDRLTLDRADNETVLINYIGRGKRRTRLS